MPSGLMAAGALFARSFFSTVDPGSAETLAIVETATALWKSVDWPSLLCDNGTLSPTGTGIPMLAGYNNTVCVIILLFDWFLTGEKSPSVLPCSIRKQMATMRFTFFFSLSVHSCFTFNSCVVQ